MFFPLGGFMFSLFFVLPLFLEGQHPLRSWTDSADQLLQEDHTSQNPFSYLQARLRSGRTRQHNELPGDITYGLLGDLLVGVAR